MNHELKSLLEKAMSMSEKNRAFIAEKLIGSLDTKNDENVETAWQQEIQKRIAEAERGEAVFLSWEDAKARLQGE